MALVAGGIFFDPFGLQNHHSLSEKLSVALSSGVFVILFLFISIGRLARYRFLSPDDIDGAGLSTVTAHAKILQALLQNTLEQCVLAIFIYLAWVMLMPTAWLSVVPLAAAAFFIGRVMFFMGYSGGPRTRALGFTLSFYPSLAMLICLVCYLIWGYFAFQI